MTVIRSDVSWRAHGADHRADDAQPSNAASRADDAQLSNAANLGELAARVADGEVLVLSGAGLSTESGIPDYRGPTGRARPASPMTITEFMASAEAQQRYWARSHLGWPAMASAQPNDGHRAVAQLQRAGLLSGIITQNVDGLQQAGGADDVIELHGALRRVICRHCHALSDRDELAARFTAANPDFVAANADIAASSVSTDSAESTDSTDPSIRPDGDVDLHPDRVSRFQTVECLDCGQGPLKPDVVFFGENVPPERVAQCYDLVARSRLVLVLGSSLTVASGFRFVRRAATNGTPVAIVNQGPTRADALTELRYDRPLGLTLQNLVATVCT